MTSRRTPDEPPATETTGKGSVEGKVAWIALAPLLLGTFCGTLNNNIVNVPLRDVMRDLKVPLSSGALVVIAFNLTFAVLMPLTGWLGDRFGRRRVFCAAVLVLALGAVGAAESTSFPMLVAFRIVQGAATAAILPTVMALISTMFGTSGRAQALGIWAAANGLGQAVGPPVGGLLANWFGWRMVFWPAVPLLVLSWVGAMRFVPPGGLPHERFDWRGAAALTVGATLLIAAASAIPHTGAGSPLVLGLAIGGAGALVAFWHHIGSVERPFIPPQLLREPSYVRSSLAVFAQMFCLGATLLAVPLFLTRFGDRSTVAVGMLVFALPAAMTVFAPFAGLASERLGPRHALRGGLVILGIGEAGVAVFVGPSSSTVGLVTFLAVVGAGVAFVQTPAATGATRSPAGRYGSGLGLFNLIRFAGSALGAVWVSIILSNAHSYSIVCVGCIAMAALGFTATFAGRSPAAISALTAPDLADP